MKYDLKRMLSIALAAGVLAAGLPFGAEGLRAEEKEDPSSEGLVGHWTFDGETEAEQLVGRSGIAALKTGTGVELKAEEGVSGGAVYFTGDNASYLTLNLTEAGQGLQAETDAFTIGAWVKYETLTMSGNSATSVFHQEGTDQGRAILTIGNTNGMTAYGTYLGGANQNSAKGIQTGKWHHVMIAVEAAGQGDRKAYIYVNGDAANGSGAVFSNALVNGNGNIRVGAHRQNTANSAVNGTIDEIRYYDRTLSAEEIKTIYEEYADADTEEPEPDAPVSITVDTGEKVRDIPPVMFGINHRYHKDGYGSWDSLNHKIYDDFGQMAKEAGFGSVRYPGGTVSNLFTWKDTIGALEDRTPTIAGNNFYSTAGENPVEPAFGVDEAMKWIYDDLGAEAVFVYGLGRGNPADAADLVEYLNAPNDGSNPNGGTDWAAVRAANGHSKPYGVVRFELGNEFSDLGQDYWMAGKGSLSAVEAYIKGGTMTFQRSTSSYYQQCGYVVKKGDWRAEASLSDGQPGEERYVCYTPVVENSITVYVDGTAWEIRDALEDCGAVNACTFDYETGKITFGDGINGNIPSEGSRITVDYQSRQSGFIEYYDAMKSTADQIGIDIEIYSGIVDRLQKDFISKMNEYGYNDKYDGVIIHPYSSGYGNADAYEASLAKERAQADYVGSHKDAMMQATGDDNKKVAVSEFGILKPDSDYQTSLGHAVYIANHMIDCVNAGAAYQNKHCLVDFTVGDNLGAWQQCVIQCHNKPDGYQYVATPSAHLFSLFNHMTGNVQIGQAIDGNRDYYSDGNGTVKTLNVYSTKDEEGNVYVTVINNHKTDKKQIAVSIEGQDLAGREIAVWYLGSEKVDDMNTLEEPDKVEIQKTTEASDSGTFTYTLNPHAVYSFKIPKEEEKKEQPKEEENPPAVVDGTENGGGGEIQNPPDHTAKTTPAAPSGVKIKKKKKGIRISWKKVKGADGYAVYRSYKKSKGYKKAAGVNAKAKQYLDKKAKKGKTVYYKIRAYKKANGQKIWGKYSKIVKIKYK